jgi:uroporphyrinogen-III decarboxylase
VGIGTRGEVSLEPVPGTVQPKKLLLRALAGERTERPPIWLMRQAGRYLPEYHRVREAAGGMVGLCNSPEHAVEVTLQPIRRFPLDAAILFADLPQVAAALGQTLDYRAGDGPVLTPPVRSKADIAEFLSVSRLHEELAPVYETVRQLTRALPPEVALIGYAGALKDKHPDIPVIAFPRGAGLSYDGFAEATGADCIGLDATVPLEWAAQRLQRGWGAVCRGTSILSSSSLAALRWPPRRTASCAP